MDQPIVPFDLHRMFIGDDPPLFYLEIVVRCLVIYGYTLVLLRWVGGRSVTQLSLVEFLLVIALGSSVGDAVFYPDVPLFHALLAITVVVVINKLIDEAILRWDLAKRIVDGGPVKLVEHGRVLMNGVHCRKMGLAELTAALRNDGVSNLGEIDAVYMEANGKLSIFRAATPVPGLVIAPPHELSHPERTEVRPEGDLCCESCGLVTTSDRLDADRSCPNCGHTGWTRPVQAEG